MTFKVAPDFEIRYIYNFTATVTDTSGNEDIQDVTIEVSDVYELIVHNGTSYDVVTSTKTGRVWLDRNLGASRVCTASNDTACYGDLYQWGRNFDGHQERNSTTTSTLASSPFNAGSAFILVGASNTYDWVDQSSIYTNGGIQSSEWTKSDGSTVCPIGFRVPTTLELRNEISVTAIFTTDMAYTSFFKLPAAGARLSQDNSMLAVGQDIYLWSSIPAFGYAEYVRVRATTISNGYTGRALGASVRCIKPL